MSQDRTTDRKFLTTQMYANDDPLSVRIRTHELYTQPQVDFNAWVLDHIPWRGDEAVLDIGCGAGSYAEPVCSRLSQRGRLISGDLSMGMLQDVAAKPLPGGVILLNADVAHLPLPDACCDVALANHMLYHVPDIERAMVEIRRVLRPGGHLIAATNASDSMETFFDEVTAASQALGYPFEIPVSPLRVRFTLESGAASIEPFFERVERYILESALVFPKAAPALAYINSTRPVYEPQLPQGLTWEALMEQAERQIDAQVVAQGTYRVSKTTGVFVAN